MEAIFTRPAASCCRRLVSAAPTSSRVVFQRPATPPGTRTKATSARTRRALNIPPHPSFLNPRNRGGDTAAEAAAPATDQIIFNPPSSAASVYHTPFKFLPVTDPRRRASLVSRCLAATNASASSSASSSSSSSSSSSPTATTPSAEDLPSLHPTPALKPKHHLTKADIEEMRRLRAADPVANSVLSLARRFQCSSLFVQMCCQAPAEHKEKMKELDEKIKARWGPRRRAARLDRARRTAMLYNGEL